MEYQFETCKTEVKVGNCVWLSIGSLVQFPLDAVTFVI